MRPLSRAAAAALPPGRSGVLLQSRDFVEGELVGLEEGAAQLDSVLFGVRALDLATQVHTIVLRAAGSVPFRYAVQTRDGTVLYAPRLETVPEGVVIPEWSGIRLPLSELVRVQQLPRPAHP